MTSENKNIEVVYRISKIQTLKFSLESNNDEGTLDKKKLIFESGIRSDIFEENRTIGITIIVKIFKDQTKKDQILEMIVRVEYQINNFKEIIKNIQVNEFEMPDPIMNTFAGIAFSTVRGILAAKTEGSIINNIYLPIIKPSELLKSLKSKQQQNSEQKQK